MAKIILLFALFYNCAFTKQQPKEEAKRRLIEVNHHMVICQGESAQWCMQIRHKDEKAWQYYYDRIENFSYEWGTSYLLEIEEKRIANPAQDASSIKWILKRVVKKTKAPANAAFDLNLGEERAMFDAAKNKIIILGKDFAISKNFPLQHLRRFKIICFRFTPKNSFEAYDGR